MPARAHTRPLLSHAQCFRSSIVVLVRVLGFIVQLFSVDILQISPLTAKLHQILVLQHLPSGDSLFYDSVTWIPVATMLTGS